jgi:hypothetical protein
MQRRGDLMNETIEHGARKTYLRGCRCEPCGDAHRTYTKAYKLRQYQSGNVCVPVGPVQAHIQRLQRTLTLSVIASLSGVSERTLRNLARGDHAKCWPSTARALFAVKPFTPPPASNRLVDSTGAMRRIRALQALGWSRDRLATMLTYDTTQLHILAHGRRPHVTARMDAEIRALYERLWCTAPPTVTQWDRGGVSRARRTAAALGWLPPMAWDETAIDNPAAQPFVGEETYPGGRRIHVEDIEFLLADDPLVTAQQLAERFRCSRDGIQQACRRAGRPDLLARLARNAEVAA